MSARPRNDNLGQNLLLFVIIGGISFPKLNTEGVGVSANTNIPSLLSYCRKPPCEPRPERPVGILRTGSTVMYST